MFKKLYSTNITNLTLDCPRNKTKPPRNTSTDLKPNNSNVIGNKLIKSSYNSTRPLSSNIRRGLSKNAIKEKSQDKIIKGYKFRDESLSKFIKEQITKNVIEDNENQIEKNKEKERKREPVKIRRKFSNSLLNDPLLNTKTEQNNESKSENLYDFNKLQDK